MATLQKKRRKKTKPVRHLWRVTVKHRDRVATANAVYSRVVMKETTLLLTSNQKKGTDPDAELAIHRANRYLVRHPGQYARAMITSVEYGGFIDE